MMWVQDGMRVSYYRGCFALCLGVAPCRFLYWYVCLPHHLHVKCAWFMQGPEQVMNAAELHELLGCDVVPLFKVVFAQMAASCAAMTQALHMSNHGQQVMSALHSGPPSALGQF